MRDIAASFSSYRREIVEEHDLGDGIVVIGQTVEAVGRASDMPLKASVWGVARLDAGRFRSYDVFLDRAAAFALAERLRGDR